MGSAEGTRAVHAMVQWELFFLAVCLSPTFMVSAGHPTFEYVSEMHACGVCREMQKGFSCERYNACHSVDDSMVQEGCISVCGAQSQLPAVAALQDVRVTKGFGTKPYDHVRISLVTGKQDKNSSGGFFDYSQQFKYRWTDNYLHTTMRRAAVGSSTVFDLGGFNITVRLPRQGDGVAGVLIADPCMLAGTTGWVGCTFGKLFKVSTRTVDLINTFVGDKSTDFWGIYGDNFYDRTGEITKNVFSRISLEAKSKFFTTVPGNHDFWVLGAPEVGSDFDQCANGFMQYYAQDAKAAEGILLGSTSPPFNFSVKPHSHAWFSCSIPHRDNFFWYNQLGNIGLIGQSGAHSLEEALPFMKEACIWLGKQKGLQLALLFGHWDIANLGAESDMAMPQWYEDMAALPGCREFNERHMLKFVMGHTHCNDPHPHGKVGAGFRVAGFGMEGCGNYGIPIVDTTADRVRMWYFDTSSDSLFESVTNCVQNRGWRNCTDHATLWLDQPFGTLVPQSLVV